MAVMRRSHSGKDFSIYCQKNDILWLEDKGPESKESERLI